MQSDLLAYAASEVAQSDTYDCLVATVVCNMSARYCGSFHRHMTRCRVADANNVGPITVSLGIVRFAACRLRCYYDFAFHVIGTSKHDVIHKTGSTCM